MGTDKIACPPIKIVLFCVYLLDYGSVFHNFRSVRFAIFLCQTPSHRALEHPKIKSVVFHITCPPVIYLQTQKTQSGRRSDRPSVRPCAAQRFCGRDTPPRHGDSCQTVRRLKVGQQFIHIVNAICAKEHDALFDIALHKTVEIMLKATSCTAPQNQFRRIGIRKQSFDIVKKWFSRYPNSSSLDLQLISSPPFP